tara:strand:- start:7479 stop:8402 length:924 start_codon:yes stop_codon:yes gene_type:complete
MSCAWCSTLTPARNTAADLSTEEALDIIDQLGELGTRAIHFSGGEPTLRKDLPELIMRAKKNRMMVCLTTNGSAPPSVFDKLLYADIIRVSIDGTEKFHDDQRVYQGAYNKAIKTLEFLISKGHKPIIASFYKDESSYPMLVELAKTCRDLGVQLGLSMYQAYHGGNGWMMSHGNGKENNLGTMYLSAIDRLKNKFGDTIVDPGPYASVVRLEGLDVYGCRAMDSSISIQADGSVFLPCPSFPQKVSKGNLKTIYYGPEAEEIHSIQGKMPECGGCLARCMISASAMLNFKGQLSLFRTYAKSFLSS